MTVLATLFKQSDGTADCQFFNKSEEIYDNVRIDPEKTSSEPVLDVVLGKAERYVVKRS